MLLPFHLWSCVVLGYLPSVMLPKKFALNIGEQRHKDASLRQRYSQEGGTGAIPTLSGK